MSSVDDPSGVTPAAGLDALVRRLRDSPLKLAADLAERLDSSDAASLRLFADALRESLEEHPATRQRPPAPAVEEPSELIRSVAARRAELQELRRKLRRLSQDQQALVRTTYALSRAAAEKADARRNGAPPSADIPREASRFADFAAEVLTLEHEIHDHLQQQLVAADIGVNLLREGGSAPDASLERLGELLDEALAASRAVAGELHDLTLRPPRQVPA